MVYMAKNKRLKIITSPYLAIWYMENGNIKHACTAACMLPGFDLEMFVDTINDALSSYTGWIYANHLNASGGALSNDWNVACKTLIKKN